MTSTDVDGRFGPNGSEGRLRTVGGFRFITDETPNPANIFNGMASMGTSGSADERGIQGTWECLEEKRDTVNAGFYRDEASIHTVLVSDEPDNSRGSDIPLPEFIDWYDGLKREADDRTYSSIVASNGGRYRNVSQQIGGIIWDLADENWRVVLDRLGVQASGLKREYFLSRFPVESTIDVQVCQPIKGEDDCSNILFERAEYDAEGALLNDNVDLVWEYNQERNSITFIAFVPEALSEVIITYDLLSATQEAPLDEDEGEDEEVE